MSSAPDPARQPTVASIYCAPAPAEVSAWVMAQAALTSPMWLNACGKLPSLPATRYSRFQASLLERAERFGHRTTIGTNAVLERSGARVGLVATAGDRRAASRARSCSRTALRRRRGADRGRPPAGCLGRRRRQRLCARRAGRAPPPARGRTAGRSRSCPAGTPTPRRARSPGTPTWGGRTRPGAGLGQSARRRSWRRQPSTSIGWRRSLRSGGACADGPCAPGALTVFPARSRYDARARHSRRGRSRCPHRQHREDHRHAAAAERLRQHRRLMQGQFPARLVGCPARRPAEHGHAHTTPPADPDPVPIRLRTGLGT